MIRRPRMLTLAIAALLLFPLASLAADIDRTAVDFKTPEEITWVKNAAGTNESVVLFGDPSKPGPYVMRYYEGAKDEETVIQMWGIGPATSTPAEKR
jgi:hypothetical protein